jgi:hypothetical protein
MTWEYLAKPRNLLFLGVYSIVTKNADLLGCEARSLGMSFTTFFRNVGNHPATQRNNPEEWNPLSLRRLVL